MSYFLKNGLFYRNDSNYLYNVEQQIKSSLIQLTSRFRYMGYKKMEMPLIKMNIHLFGEV